MGGLGAAAWAAIVCAVTAVVGLVYAVVKDMNARQEVERKRAAKLLRDAEVKGYLKRQAEVRDRVLGLLDTALAFCGPGEGQIRRLLTTMQQVVSQTTMKEDDDDAS